MIISLWTVTYWFVFSVSGTIGTIVMGGGTSFTFVSTFWTVGQVFFIVSGWAVTFWFVDSVTFTFGTFGFGGTFGTLEVTLFTFIGVWIFIFSRWTVTVFWFISSFSTDNTFLWVLSTGLTLWGTFNTFLVNFDHTGFTWTGWESISVVSTDGTVFGFFGTFSTFIVTFWTDDVFGFIIIESGWAVTSRSVNSLFSGTFDTVVWSSSTG